MFNNDSQYFKAESSIEEVRKNLDSPDTQGK
jgi:hypothetical protein